MIHINSEGTQFDYVFAYCAVSVIKSVWSNPPPSSFDLATGQDTRLSLFCNLLNSKRRNPYWLVWQSPKDLAELDSRAQLGHTDDEDFADAFRTILQTTTCSQCGAQFHTLIIDPGDPYPNVPALHREKIEKLKIRQCPVCRGSFRQLVAKILDFPPSGLPQKF